MTNQKEGTIIKISGALIEAKNMSSATMYELVRVSNENLIGEVIKIEGDIASIQVYEETTGISPGEPVRRTGSQLAVELGPGLLGEIYDGIQRPLRGIAEKTGDFITRGVDVPALSLEKEWHFKPLVKTGDVVEAGDIIGEVQETQLLSHKIMVPPNLKKGSILSIKDGGVSLKDIVATIKTDDGKEVDVFMSQRWPIRKPRPIKEKSLPSKPLITGQRIVDSFFPVAKGGAACIPGPFGAGKTVTLSQFAKWSDADIIIHIGCGERGNEMTDALIELQELVDPKTNRPLLERTVIIANTSNMPVAAREASIYTGITIAEYFRDMGYDVALMADSTSRWAEALREMSARLEEMPGEEGYPAYLGSRVASFYERAGYVKCLGSGEREGSLTVIGSVSPPGGDLSEPVTQNTLRVNKVFWGLEDKLANARHFPAINWLSSYSMYLEDVAGYYKENAGSDFMEIRDELMRVLSEEAKLEEIVRLVGYEALSNKDKLTLETAKIVREDFLQQNAFDEVDSYTSLKKQYWMLSRIINFYRNGMKLLEEEKTIKEIMESPEHKGLARMKFEELTDN